MKELIKDLCLIDGVIVDYVEGRRRGFTDEQTERRAMKAVIETLNLLDSLLNIFSRTEAPS